MSATTNRSPGADAGAAGPATTGSSAPDAPRAGGKPAMGGVARGSSANLVGAVVMAACTFALTVAVTRGLSKEAAGIFFSATSLFVLATSVGQLGTNTGLVYFMSRVRSLGRESLIGAYYRTATRPVLVTAVVMAALMLVFAEPLGGLVTPGHADETAAYLRVLALFIPLAGWENITLAATRGLTTMRPTVLVEQVARPVLQLGLVAAAVFLIPTSGALAWAWASPYLPAAVAGFLWWRVLSRRVARSASQAAAEEEVGQPETRSQRRAETRVGREFWRFSGPRALASVGQIAMQRLDIILVAALAGPAEAAVYTASTRFLVVGQMGNRAISTAVQPRLGAALALHKIDDANHYYRTSTAWLVLVTWPLYLTFIVFGSVLLKVFGEGYSAGDDVLRLLSFAMLLGTACGMVDMVLNMAGKTSWNLYNVLLSVGVQFTLLLILVPKLGIMGAAIGWAAAIATSNLVPLAQIGLKFGLHPFGKAPVTAVCLAVVCYGGIGLLGRLALGEDLVALLVTLAVATVAYAGGVWWFRRPLELAALRDIRRRGKRRADAEESTTDDAIDNAAGEAPTAG